MAPLNFQRSISSGKYGSRDGLTAANAFNEQPVSTSCLAGIGRRKGHAGFMIIDMDMPLFESRGIFRCQVPLRTLVSLKRDVNFIENIYVVFGGSGNRALNSPNGGPCETQNYSTTLHRHWRWIRGRNRGSSSKVGNNEMATALSEIWTR